MSKGHGVSGYTHTQKQLDDYANQHNPNNQAYWDNLNNHSNQCTPNNDEYWHSRENEKTTNKKQPQAKKFPPAAALILILIHTSIIHTRHSLKKVT